MTAYMVTTDEKGESREWSVPAVVRELKQSDQDHEFYPTTDEIIRALAQHVGMVTTNEYGNKYRPRNSFTSVLDIGAGNGKVLLALRDKCGLTDLHAIEKSSVLCRDLDPEIMVVGTEFHEQSLLSKAVDVIFCNPPYSEFVEWSEKIIRQSASKVIYLVIPIRWEQSVQIKDAIRFRDAEVKKIGEFDFEDAEDRKARAKVHLLCITLKEGEDDAFERFFEEQFSDLINKFKLDEELSKDDEEEGEEGKDSKGGGRNRPFHKLVPGPNYPDAMVNLYRQEMANIENNYRLVGELDVDLLREFEIFPPKIMACLKTRLKGLRNDYWHELFSRLSTITDRLTSKSRQALLNTLHKHVQVDFTTPNIYEIIIWVIKNANRYIDSQLIDTYELMVDKCNVQLYKSNKRVWEEDRWRYNGECKNSHFALDYRIVTHRVGGVNCRYSSGYSLNETAAIFLGDLRTIARNMGFVPVPVFNGGGFRDNWEPGEQREYFCHYDKKRVMLYDVRAFKNGNLHLRFNQEFILALNVEYGRLKGWLRSGDQAAEELQEPKAAAFFRSNIQIETGNPTLLLTA